MKKPSLIIQIIGPGGPFGKTTTAVEIIKHLESLGHSTELSDGFYIPKQLPQPPKKPIPMHFKIQVISAEMPAEDERVCLEALLANGGVSAFKKSAKAALASTGFWSQLPDLDQINLMVIAMKYHVGAIDIHEARARYLSIGESQAGFDTALIFCRTFTIKNIQQALEDIPVC